MERSVPSGLPRLESFPPSIARVPIARPCVTLKTSILVSMKNVKEVVEVERVQTGVRLEKRLLKITISGFIRPTGKPVFEMR